MEVQLFVYSLIYLNILVNSNLGKLLGFPCVSAGKESTCNAGDLVSIPGLGRSLGVGKGYPLQYSGLENSMDCIVHGVTKSQTRLSDFHFHFMNKAVMNGNPYKHQGPWLLGDGWGMKGFLESLDPEPNPEGLVGLV